MQGKTTQSNRCLFGNQANFTMRAQRGSFFGLKTGGTSNTCFKVLNFMARSKEGWATYGTLPCTYQQRVIYHLSDVEWKHGCEKRLERI